MRLVDWIPTGLATTSQLLPFLAVVPAWRRATEPRRWIAIWCLFFFVSDLLQLAISRLSGNNLWYFTYAEPVEDVLLLWALSHWQVKQLARIAIRVSIPLVVVAYVLLIFATGEQSTYKTISHPFRALVFLLWTAYTLLSNLEHRPEGVWGRDWLWTSLGVMLYFGLFAAIDPIVAAMDPADVGAMLFVYNARAIGDVIAFVLIWRGMRCPLPISSSGST